MNLPPPLLTPEALELRTERDLDWAALLDRVAGFASSPRGSGALRARRPAREFSEAQRLLACTRASLSLDARAVSLPRGELPELLDFLEQLARGMIATGLELRDLGKMLAFAKELRAFAREWRDEFPELTGALTSDARLDRLAQRLESSLDNDGALTDSASPELARCRKRVSEQRQELQGLVKRLLVSYSDVLRDQYFAERDGRYVLPVRADAHRAVEGSVLDASSSGSTLYVEPRELSQPSSRLRIAEAAVRDEEERIFRQLSEECRRALEALRCAESACTEADQQLALVRWAKATDSSALPLVSEPLLELRAMRHPLLLGQGFEVIANDLVQKSGQATVISGPNAGGKTVALKCLGLAVWMARSGIPIPAHPDSRVGWFSQIFTDVGDSQSLVSSLSTFSAHVRVLASFLAATDSHTLCLLDEVAAGTDPEEGSALATAVLTGLIERGGAVVATTHYEPLKELALRDERFHNIAVGFDLKTFLPTYMLLDGIAGPSTALAVAARYGIPENLIEFAETLVPESSRERERMLRELTSDRAAAAMLLREAEREVARQRALRLDLEQERARLETEERRVLESQYRELVGAVRRARAELSQQEQRLRQTPVGEANLRETERMIDAAAHVVAIGGPVALAAVPSKPVTGLRAPLLSELKPGQKVHVPRLGGEAEVLSISSRGEVRVTAGVMRLTLSLAELRLDPRQLRAPRPSPAMNLRKTKSRVEAPSSGPRPLPMRLESNTLDLRGIRVDEGLSQVDTFVDTLLERHEPLGYILHGHGTGAMKQAVREHLRACSYVTDSQPAAREDGGDAFTLFYLS